LWSRSPNFRRFLLDLVKEIIYSLVFGGIKRSPADTAVSSGGIIVGLPGQTKGIK
jgi:hypothetical protein